MSTKLAPIVLVVGLVVLVGSVAAADPINPGFDLLHTPPGGAFIDLTPLGVGIVDLEGNPLDLDVSTNVDTIVERNTGIPGEGTGVIDVEIVALSLVSIDPIEISGSFFDVFVTLDPSNPSTGQIDVTSHTPGANGGGTFDSFFDVFVEINFVPVGSTTPVQTLFANDQISSQDSPWSHVPPPGYPMLADFPSGGFYPGPIEHTGPHPRTEPGRLIPEPATALIMGLGALMGLGRAHIRRRSKA